jgi:hypothetical protein
MLSVFPPDGNTAVAAPDNTTLPTHATVASGIWRLGSLNFDAPAALTRSCRKNVVNSNTNKKQRPSLSILQGLF